MSSYPESNGRLLQESLLSLSQAGRRFPRTRQGRSPHPTPSAVWRWVRDGVLAPGGQRVRLEALFVAGRWLTSAEALGRFALAQQPDVPDTGANNPAAPKSASPADRRRAAERAGQELERLGL